MRPVPKPTRWWSPEKRDWIRSLPCVLRDQHKCFGRTEACHFPSRGAFGDDTRMYPGCRVAHDEEHHGAQSFQQKYRIDLHTICQEYHELWLQETAA